LRILISAYTCVPGRGSEPGVGWGFLRAAAKQHDVTALVPTDEIPLIREGLEEERLSVRLVGVDVPHVMKGSRFRRGIGHLAYLVWQLRAARIARSLAAEVDVAHHVTYCVDWMPTGMWALSNTPVVWGPVGGTATFHPQSVRYLSIAGLLQEILREAVTRSLRAAIVAPIARHRSDVVVACNREVANRFRAGNMVVIEATSALEPLQARPNRQPIRSSVEKSHTAMYAGRLEAWKGPYLALETLAKLDESWRLEIYGDGMECKGLRRRASRLGLLRRVVFRGPCPRAEVRAAMCEADVFLFPSFHDASPWVVAEAIQVGCPVVCLDAGGPAMLVASGGGIAVPFGRRLPERLARAVTEVERQPPSDRWDKTRLPDQVSQWYELAWGRRHGDKPAS
jgi:glycosyltransferase involved in cell wall biosynthesis